MTNFEKASIKEKYVMLKNAHSEAKKLIKNSKVEFCTMSRERYLKGMFERTEENVKTFENNNPEVLI